MSLQYSTVDSELSDAGDDMQDLLNKNNKLSLEIELLNKDYREKEYLLNRKLKELENENEKLKSQNKNLEELLKTYKNTKPASAISNNQTNKTIEANDIIINILNQKISDFENNIFHLTQSEQDLIRQNQSLKREISDLNLDIDKLKINSSKNNTKNINSKMNESCDLIDLDNMDDEKKIIIQELIKEFEETKKENLELREKAINTLTEKEIANMALRDQIDELKNKFNLEINNYIQQIQSYKTKLNDIEIDKSYYEGDDISFTKEETKELIDKYAKLEDDYNIIKQELDEKEFNHDNDRMKTQNELERMVYNYKTSIFNLEQEISRYKQELSSYEMDKAQQEIEKEQDYENKNILVSELEKYQNKFRLIEESKEKIEQKYREQVNYLNIQICEIDRQNNILKNNKNDAEKELNEFKIQFNNKIKEEKGLFKVDLIAKDKENYAFKEKLEILEKENYMKKQSIELSKVNYEKLKCEYNTIYENMKKIKEMHENELQKIEDKYNFLERKYEKRNTHYDRDMPFNSSSLCQTLPNIGTVPPQKPRMTNSKMNYQTPNSDNNVKSLMDALDSAVDESSSQSQIIFLQNEVILQKDQISELNIKIYKYQNTKEDFDFIVKENKKIKADLKEMEILYEKQISDLHQKTLNMNVELDIVNKKRLTVSKRESIHKRKPTLTSISEVNESVDVSKYKAEGKFLTEKIEILKKEMAKMKDLFEKDIKYLKEELKTNETMTINAKISLATLAFEKDCEILKYKNYAKKLKMRLQNGVSSDNSAASNNKITGVFKNFFK